MSSDAARNFTDLFDADRLETARKIREYGFVVRLVGFGVCSIPGCDCARDPEPWAYTVGCVELGHPEVVSLGCCHEHTHSLVNAAVGAYRAGRPIPIGDRSGTMVDGILMALTPVPVEWVASDPDRIAAWWDHYEPGRPDVTAPDIVQLVVADADGVFPWDRPDGPPILADDPFNHPPRLPRRIRRAAERNRRGRPKW